MERRQRLVVAAIWLAVAGLMATTIDPATQSTANAGARTLVVAVALLLAGVYAFDPWHVASREPFD